MSSGTYIEYDPLLSEQQLDAAKLLFIETHSIPSTTQLQSAESDASFSITAIGTRIGVRYSPVPYCEVGIQDTTINRLALWQNMRVSAACYIVRRHTLLVGVTEETPTAQVCDDFYSRDGKFVLTVAPDSDRVPDVQDAVQSVYKFADPLQTNTISLALTHEVEERSRRIISTFLSALQGNKLFLHCIS